MNVSRLLPVCCGIAAFAPLPVHSRETLVRPGSPSTWQYLDAGQRVEASWTSPEYDTSKWKSGPAPLGYAEDDLGTVVSFGPDEKDKPLTTYFRRTVEVSDPAGIENIVFDLKRDDGAVIYWNGKEAARSNMPDGTITATTPAAQTIGGRMGQIVHSYMMPAKGTVLKGRNVIAVEVHQSEAASSDLLFDLEVTALAAGDAIPSGVYYKETKAALEKGDRKHALDLLLKLDSGRHDYVQFMSEVLEHFSLRSSPTDERYMALVDKIYAAAPEDMRMAYAWVRSRVDARLNLPIKPARRTLPAKIPDEFRFIADTPPSATSGKTVAREKLLADVDDLELVLVNCYSYLERNGANYRGALDALRASITEDIPVSLFAHRVSRMLTVFGDPHSAVTNRSLREPRVPVLFVMAGDKLAALAPDHTGFFVPEFPFVSLINGRPVNEWIAAAEHIVPQASPQFRKILALQQLRELSSVAREMGSPLAAGATIPAVFLSADGKEKKTANLSVPPSRVSEDRVEWPETASQIIKGDIGYLRIAEMDSGTGFIASLDDWMKKFDETRGLIIDVRGNGGGTQDAIKTLLPWFMKSGSPMKIINIAAYRLPLKLPHKNPAGFLGLGGRGLHPASSSVWNQAESTEIETFLEHWTPRWKLPDGKFSDWHVMAISHETNPEAGYYEKPVIVLMDARCFSATDNFLGALKGHPNITLVGSSSGGGSGRMAGYALPHSGVQLTLCQMASFAATGQTYDGVGVTPDVPMEATLDDQIDGRGDSVLEAAVARLKK